MVCICKCMKKSDNYYFHLSRQYSFKKYKGLFGFEFQKQIKNNFDSKITDEIIPLEVEDGVEYVPAPYYCVNGCGGNVTDPSDINVYDNGQCIQQGLCK